LQWAEGSGVLPLIDADSENIEAGHSLWTSL
jgi:hypothetical protein